MLNHNTPNLADLRGGLAPTAIARREAKQACQLAVLEAAAKVLVLVGRGAHNDPKVVNLLLPPEHRLHTINPLLVIGLRKLVKRLAAGGLFMPGELGRWSGGLFHGLRMSGAIVVSRGHKGVAAWTVCPLGARPVLEKALSGGLPFAGEAKVSPRGIRLSNLWAVRLGPDDPDGADVVAGLLMGGTLWDEGGKTWLAIRSSEEARGLLGRWGIPIGGVGRVAGRVAGGRDNRGQVDLVSPFWGALFSWLMPLGMREWYFGIRKPGMCPLLPWAFLKMAGGRSMGYKGFPREAVPFLLSSFMLYIHGIGMRAVHERAVRDLGFVRVDSRLQQVWLWYMASIGVKVEGLSVGILDGASGGLTCCSGCGTLISEQGGQVSNRRKIDWSLVDWKLQDVEVARLLKVSRERVRQVRPIGVRPDGYRKHAGVTAGQRIAAMVTEGKTAQEVARAAGCGEDYAAVVMRRLQRGYKRKPKGNARYDWSLLPDNWRELTDKVMAELVGASSVAVVAQWRLRHGMAKRSGSSGDTGNSGDSGDSGDSNKEGGL